VINHDFEKLSTRSTPALRRVIDGKTIIPRVLRWYRRYGRKLPWRGIANPYYILVSEIMLQQTQVSRVLEKYPLFLKTFPTLPALARASRGTVIRSWQGMGYNSRAVRLHMLAHLVVVEHNGKIPPDYGSLRSLPGIGQYTARAILSSAFGMPEAVVDINIRRLFSRLFWNMSSMNEMQPESDIWALAHELLPRRAAYDWNQALMDLGATICTARAPRCADCPVAASCMSRMSLQTASSAGAMPAPVKREPSYRGTPTRIYRGRIVEELRRMPEGSTIAFAALARKVFVNPARTDSQWMEKTLQRLERDGLVKLEKKRAQKRVSLL
jgi:A/G-specific adenine glycosylase